LEVAVRISIALVALMAAIGLDAGLTPARADSADAICQIRKDGEKKHDQSGPCTFSQRQGYIDLNLRNGDNISLSPTKQPNQFKDQKGNKVVRTQAGGNTQEFKWENGRKVVVTFGAPSTGGGSGGSRVAVPDMPRYCAGEAAARFNVSPRDITTQAAAKDHGMHSVWGQYPASPSPQAFICTFNAEGQFVGVDKHRP
jgi:hypothetical protein